MKNKLNRFKLKRQGFSTISTSFNSLCNDKIKEEEFHKSIKSYPTKKNKYDGTKSSVHINDEVGQFDFNNAPHWSDLMSEAGKLNSKDIQ